MKKILIIVGFIMVCALAGCSPKQAANNISNQITPKPQPQVIETKDYKSVNSADISTDAASWFASFGNKTGSFIYQHPDYTYLKLVVPGTGIKITKFENGNVDKNVEVTYTKGNENESLILKVANNNISNFKVTANGVPLSLEQKVIYGVFNLPAENSEITNPVNVKGKMAVFEATFAVRVIDANGKILKEEQVKSSEGAPAWGNFEKSIAYDKPTTTGKIVAIEYSAKDGTPIERASVNVKFKK